MSTCMARKSGLRTSVQMMLQMAECADDDRRACLADEGRAKDEEAKTLARRLAILASKRAQMYRAIAEGYRRVAAGEDP
jgi:hypothetical protein